MKYLPVVTEVDHWFTNGAAAAGAGVVMCRRGCAACCHGPFDISPADAELVVLGLETLEPAARRQVEHRAARQVERYRDALPAWHLPWDVDTITEAQFDDLADTLASMPCPALSDTGDCVIHEFRPATCRMTGLPMLAGADTLENVCPIVDTSPAFAALAPVPFDLARFEDRADTCDIEARAHGYVGTTVAGAIAMRSTPAHLT